MEVQGFDDLSRTLALQGTRRSVFGGLLGILGFGELEANKTRGESKLRRRRARRRKRRERRRKRGLLRAIKVIVDNPSTNPQTIEVELGYSPVPYKCCQGQAGYMLPPGQGRIYTTEEVVGYLWVENQYFIAFENLPLGPPAISWAINGASVEFRADCCKPKGQTLGHVVTIDEGETKELNFSGRHIRVSRLGDEEDYKVFFVKL